MNPPWEIEATTAAAAMTPKKTFFMVICRFYSEVAEPGSCGHPYQLRTHAGRKDRERSGPI